MDLSWSELLIIGIVALIIIGPKDLPGMFRELGRFTAKVRAMGREFGRAMEAAAKETGVKDVADDLRKVSSPSALGLDAVKSAADRFEKWDPLKSAVRPPAAAPAAPLTPPPSPVAAPGTNAAPVAPVGPNTAALYDKQAARKAVLDEAAAKLRAIADPGKPAEAPAKPAGRRRSRVTKPETPGEGAE